MTAPASASLGSAAPGGTTSANLGTVQVTDDRGFGATWTVDGRRHRIHHRRWECPPKRFP